MTLIYFLTMCPFCTPKYLNAKEIAIALQTNQRFESSLSDTTIAVRIPVRVHSVRPLALSQKIVRCHDLSKHYQIR